MRHHQNEHVRNKKLEEDTFEVNKGAAGGSITLDADAVNAGDLLMCPSHPEKLLFLFGTGWWESNGGTVHHNGSHHNAAFEAYCSSCQAYWSVMAWSYAG